MAFANLSSLTKKNRANQIITAIGTSGFMTFWTGSIPASPDIAPSGILLASLPLAATAGVASFAVAFGVITAPGTGGTDGVYALTVTGDGTGVIGTYTVTGGILSSIAITDNGSGFTTPPTFGGFGLAGLTGATSIPVMTGIILFNSISTATSVATGTVGFVRITTSGGTGILDLDAGTTNSFSVIMDNTFIANSSPVSVITNIILEA